MIVDAFAFTKFHPYCTITVESLQDHDADIKARARSFDLDLDEVERAGASRPTSQELAENKALAASRREWLMMIDPFLPGFSLKNKTWCKQRSWL